MFFIRQFIQYILNAKGRHGIHSPFVYDLVDTCLTIKLSNSFKLETQKSHKKFAHNQNIIQINDKGAGSKKLSNNRTIQQIYRNASTKGTYRLLLCQLMEHYNPESCLEFGTSLGIGTHCLTYKNSSRKITTIDACAATQHVAQENFSTLGIDHQIDAICSTFQEYLKNLSPTQKFDFIYIDGHHSGDALLQYLSQLKQHANADTIFVLDDIRWNEDMFAAWQKIIKDEDFHLTLDVFRMGIVFLRPQQHKEHFVIKLKNVLTGF